MLPVVLVCLMPLLCMSAVTLEAICPSQIVTIAHRGNSAESPENTIASFKECLDLCVDYIEFDVHLSKDNVPVVIHDISITRTGKGEEARDVMDLTIEELKNVDVGEWFGSEYAGETIPTLKEVLELPLGNTGLMVEVKAGSAPPKLLAEHVSKPIVEYNRMKEGHAALVGSLSPDVLEELQKQIPEGFFIAIISDTKEIDRFMKLNPKVVALQSSIATKELIDRFASRNVATWIYTVDDTTAMQHFIDMGARGIITNKPKALLNLKAEYAKKCKNLIDTESQIEDPEVIRQ